MNTTQKEVRERGEYLNARSRRNTPRKRIPNPVAYVLIAILYGAICASIAAFVLSLTGCGGTTLYGEGFEQAPLDAAAEGWKRLDSHFDVIAVPRGGVPDHADRIVPVRSGLLGHSPDGLDVCADTDWGTFQVLTIHIDLDCIERDSLSLHDTLSHEFGHDAMQEHGARAHLPPGEVGMMARTGYDPERGEHSLSCADAGLYASLKGESWDVARNEFCR